MSLLIASTRRKLKQLYLQRLAELDVTPPQMSALLCLAEAGEVCLGKLAVLARTDEPTASRVVTKLVGAGWVQMKPDAEDRRRTRIALTATGRAMAKRLAPIAAEVEAELMAELSPTEHRALTASLMKLRERVERVSAEGEEAAPKRRRAAR